MSYCHYYRYSRLMLRDYYGRRRRRRKRRVRRAHPPRRGEILPYCTNNCHYNMIIIGIIVGVV